MKNNSIFIDGLNQAISIIKHLDEELVTHIAKRDPKLASHLTYGGADFSTVLEKLEPAKLRIVFAKIEAPIIGLAIKELNKSLQQKILKAAPPEYACEAYDYMTRVFTNQKKGVERARERILEVIRKMAQTSL